MLGTEVLVFEVLGSQCVKEKNIILFDFFKKKSSAYGGKPQTPFEINLLNFVLTC